MKTAKQVKMFASSYRVNKAKFKGTKTKSQKDKLNRTNETKRDGKVAA